MFLWILSWISSFFLLMFSVFCLAAGVYQLAELVEEYTVISKKVIFGLFWVATAGLIGSYLFEGFPTSVFLLGISSHVCFFIILGTFPFISMTSPAFIGAIVLILAHHYFLLGHFEAVWYPFSEILAYVIICMWSVPFALFISLSANDYVLPTTSSMSSIPPANDMHGMSVLSKFSVIFPGMEFTSSAALLPFCQLFFLSHPVG